MDISLLVENTILKGENQPLLRLYESLGKVVVAEPWEINAKAAKKIKRINVLVTRSKVKVTKELIDAAEWRAIATVTAGTDHIDTAYAKKREIPVIYAPGSNSNAVAEFFFTAIGYVLRGREKPLSKYSLGVIGNGHCGSAVVRIAQGFGMETRIYDPPLHTKAPESFKQSDLEETLACDIVTLHIPLTKSGKYATKGMINEETLRYMKKGAYLVNMSRGGVLDTQAVIDAIHKDRIGGVITDVFANEPSLSAEDRQLADNAVLATPHVAGWAAEALRRGAVQAYYGICEALNTTPDEHADDYITKGLKERYGHVVEINGEKNAVERAFLKLLEANHDIAETSWQFKTGLGRASSSGHAAICFNWMRAEHNRREIAGKAIQLDIKDRKLSAHAEKLALAFNMGIYDSGRGRQPNYIMRIS